MNILLHVRFYFLLLLNLGLVELFSGCGSSERLSGRIGMLEKRIGDLHRAQGKLAERIDEMEIRLTMLSKRFNLNQGASYEKKLSRGTRVAPIDTRKAKPKRAYPKRWKVKPASKYRKLMSEIDPALVHEKLPPDPAKGSMLLSQHADHSSDPGFERAMIEFGQASQYYRSSKHKQVVTILTDWLKQHGEHHLAVDAHYLLGSSRIALGDLDKAQSDLVVLAQKYPRSKKAPQALLMAGQCQEKLGWPRQARSTYLQLVESYPLSREAADANERLKVLR